MSFATCYLPPDFDDLVWASGMVYELQIPASLEFVVQCPLNLVQVKITGQGQARLSLYERVETQVAKAP